MSKDTIIIDDETTNRVAVELSHEIANAIEAAVQLADQGQLSEAQALIGKLCADVRYQPMVGVIPNGNVKLTEHPVIQHYAQELANASRFGEANFSIPLNGRGPWTPALKGKLDINDMIREVHGLRIIIENAKGSLRCGYTKDGKRWEVRMPADYGYVSAVDVAANSNPNPHAGRPGQVGGSAPSVGTLAEYYHSLGGKPSHEAGFHYHATSEDKLESIKKHGLIPKSDKTFKGFDSGKRVSLAPTFEDAEYWGMMAHVVRHNSGIRHRPVLLRVLRDQIETKPAARRSEVLADKVDPKHLEVWRDGKWSGISEVANSFIPTKPGADGDGVDCWLGEVSSDQVHIIDQRDLDTKKFDEHKCFVDFASRQEAIATYLRAYSDGKAHQRIMGVRTMTVPQFKAWLQTAKTKKRASRRNFVNEGEGHPFHGNQWTKVAKDPSNDPVGHPAGKLKHAVLVIGGKRYKGPSHFQALMKFHEVRPSTDPKSLGMLEGFETESGHFLDRIQASDYTGKNTIGVPAVSQQFHLQAANGQLYTQDPLMANEELTEEQQRHDKLRSHLEKIYRQELEDAVFQSEQEMLAKPDDQHHLELALLALLFLLRDGLKTAGQKSYVIAAKTLLPGLLQSGLPSSRRGFDVGEAAKSYAQERAPKLENAVNKVKSKVYNSIQRGVAGGESKQALARRIREGFEQAQPEIDLIAETEPQVVYGIAQHEALKLAGFERKKWITQNDERVRHSHTLCEAQGAIGIDQSFHNGLKFPGDPNGPASEVINCRCWLLGEA